ncbi:hypothetical protein BD289DRAFT_435177 [Coniella lustricola]|uniref:Secreted protein n=1 Tax=Coniella lustricola TaxID=2025994 RepID=A0A2T3A6R1_9PEZI|nr:hypothetical protein BD289DRAFT_435177 [Coniella lustricola]
MALLARCCPVLQALTLSLALPACYHVALAALLSQPCEARVSQLPGCQFTKKVLDGVPLIGCGWYYHSTFIPFFTPKGPCRPKF